MRASVSILLIGFLGFTVSCAHKKPIQETAKTTDKKVEKVEKKVEAKAETKKAEKEEIAYTCLVGKDKRTVILDKKDKRCEVNYTKFGDAQQVAWAENTPDICDKAFNSIRTNIEGSGFKCLDGLNAKFEEKKDKKDDADQEGKKPRETAATATK